MNEHGAHPLLEPEAIKLLQAYGIPYPDHGMAATSDEAVQIAERLGYPVVLKVVSPEVLHKSDVGGVLVGLTDARSVRQAYDQIRKSVTDHVPGADIRGVLVCRQAEPGLEVIVGALQDALFGPTLMFGLGGVLVEVLKDVSFRVTPLDRQDAEAMVKEIQGYPLLKGVRGQPGADIPALVDLLVNVSQMVTEHPEVHELDLNPVRVYDKGVLVLDARILTN
jgi:acyl-CoA synthetase (NDP forming)